MQAMDSIPWWKVVVRNKINGRAIQVMEEYAETKEEVIKRLKERYPNLFDDQHTWTAKILE